MEDIADADYEHVCKDFEIKNLKSDTLLLLMFLKILEKCVSKFIS